jgi:hypothetical protein
MQLVTVRSVDVHESRKGVTMKKLGVFMKLVAVTLVILLTLPVTLLAQEPEGKVSFSQAELEQILAPIALYPDDVLAQILIASTYPLEIVQADRWAKQNSSLKGDKLTAALEKQPWDPSVKSLINFPQVLSMMSEKLDLTQKLGDAFLAQQKDVMKAIQTLRAKAEVAGNLKSTKEQKVIVEKETIIIQPANPQVVYVPTYNPTVVYGVWAYPAYPPAYYYPPPSTAFWSFAAGVAVGAAWGYAWGNCNWGHGGYYGVNYNINKNININNNINRGAYASHYQGGKGNWQHNPSHRGGVAYRDRATATQYNRGGSQGAVKSRESYRGRADAVQRDLGSGGAGQRPSAGQLDRGAGSGQRGGASQMDRSLGADRRSGSGAVDKGRGSGGSNAFSGMDRGSSAKDFSSRGSQSRQSMSRGGGFGGGGGGRRR